MRSPRRTIERKRVADLGVDPGGRGAAVTLQHRPRPVFEGGRAVRRFEVCSNILRDARICKSEKYAKTPPVFQFSSESWTEG